MLAGHYHVKSCLVIVILFNDPTFFFFVFVFFLPSFLFLRNSLTLSGFGLTS